MNPLVSLVFDEKHTNNFNEYNSTTWMIEIINNYCILFFLLSRTLCRNQIIVMKIE